VAAQLASTLFTAVKSVFRSVHKSAFQASACVRIRQFSRIKSDVQAFENADTPWTFTRFHIELADFEIEVFMLTTVNQMLKRSSIDIVPTLKSSSDNQTTLITRSCHTSVSNVPFAENTL